MHPYYAGEMRELPSEIKKKMNKKKIHMKINKNTHLEAIDGLWMMEAPAQNDKLEKIDTSRDVLVLAMINSTH